MQVGDLKHITSNKWPKLILHENKTASQLNKKESLVSGKEFENTFTQFLIMHMQLILIMQPCILLY